jgi:hypothetical protein
MSLRLYLDEDSMDRALVQALRARGLDVETAYEAGTIAQSDESQLRHAAEQRRVLVTYNARDFCRLHREFLLRNEGHMGVVISDQSHSVGEALRRLLRLSGALSAEQMENHLEFLSAWR